MDVPGGTVLDQLLPFMESDDSELIVENSTTAIRFRRDEKFLVSSFDVEDYADQVYEFAWSQNRRLDFDQPYATGSCRDAQGTVYRWHAVVYPLRPEKSPSFSLRRLTNQGQHFSLADFDLGPYGLSDLAVTLNHHLFVCGPTGIGKTSFLNAFLKEYCAEERILILDGTEEIQQASPFWCYLERPQNAVHEAKAHQFSNIFATSLRLRPGRIVVGEIRMEEWQVFNLAANSGHLPTMTTLHVSSKEEFHQRLKDQGLEEANLFPCSLIFLRLNKERLPAVAAIERVEGFF